MNDRCGYCGNSYEQDRCSSCERMRNDPPRRYVVLGPGFMGDYDAVGPAQALRQAHPRLSPAALYVRSDVAIAAGMDPSILEV